MLDMIKDCGGMGWLAILVSVIAFSAAAGALIIGFVANSKPVAIGVSIAAVLLSLSVGFVGVVGNLRGKAMTEQALAGASIDPEQKARILAEGEKEAGECISVGLVFMVLPLLISGGALVVGLTKKPRT